MALLRILLGLFVITLHAAITRPAQTRPRPSSPRPRRSFRPGQPRDQIGHWVTPVRMAGHPCPHACCAGKRVHPEQLPVKLDRTYLRSLSETELERELDQYMGYYEIREHGAQQLMAELDRRDLSEKRAAARKERAKATRARRDEEWRDEVYRQWFHAERETKGVMLNKAGLRAGVDERSLFAGPESRVVKYASPELIEYFETHPRPTRASFLGSTRERREHLSGRRIG